MINTQLNRVIKAEDQKAIKKSISMPQFMLNDAVERARNRKFTTLSDYIQDLVRRDTALVVAN